MNFVPEQDRQAIDVPYYEQARQSDGWQGHTTTKSIDRLQSEVTESITRLGGFVSGFQKGTFRVSNKDRDGFQIHYSIPDQKGGFVAGRFDVAALPVKDKWNKTKKDKSLRMSLFMLRVCLDGMWLFQQLSPGYAPLMPFVIANNDGKTISQLWAEQSPMGKLLPPPSSEFVEGEIV